MPVDFSITTNASTIDTVLQIDEQFMTFHFDIPPGETVTNLVMDPGGWILKSDDYVVGLADDIPVGFASFKLDQNFPNPFNPMTTIPSSLDLDGPVQMIIVDIRGREVRELVSENQLSGQHQVTWNSQNDQGQAVEAGVYFCSLQSGGRTEIQKLILVK